QSLAHHRQTVAAGPLFARHRRRRSGDPQRADVHRAGARFRRARPSDRAPPAMRLGGEVVPLAVNIDPDATRRLCELWKHWDLGLTYGSCPARTAPWWHPPSVSSEPKSRRDASLSSCSPTSNQGADATE